MSLCVHVHLCVWTHMWADGVGGRVLVCFLLFSI